jgi:hypothetical protein
LYAKRRGRHRRCRPIDFDSPVLTGGGGMLMSRHNAFHAVFQPQLDFLKGDFFDEVFGAEVRLLVDFFDSGFTAGVFFGEESELCIVGKKRLPYIIACDGHASLLGLGFTFTWDSHLSQLVARANSSAQKNYS